MTPHNMAHAFVAHNPIFPEEQFPDLFFCAHFPECARDFMMTNWPPAKLIPEPNGFYVRVLMRSTAQSLADSWNQRQ